MHDEFNPALLIPLAGIMLPMFLVPTIMAMKQTQRRREWEHLERMKALELGRPLPSAQVWPALATIAIGAIMPMGVFIVAWLASPSASGSAFEGAAFVGVCGVFAGAFLGKRLFAERSTKPADLETIAKPRFDPEAYDVVGRRG